MASIDLIARGQNALHRRRWAEARAAFEEALETAEAPEALEGLGLASWWLDDAELTFRARERADRLSRERGDSLGAGRIATWLAWDYLTFRGESAIPNGWLQQAHRLLDGFEPCAEQVWLALRSASILLPADAERAQALSAQARRLAGSLKDPELEAVSLALDGLVRVSPRRGGSGHGAARRGVCGSSRRRSPRSDGD
jgi:hypothetical protein